LEKKREGRWADDILLRRGKKKKLPVWVAKEYCGDFPPPPKEGKKALSEDNIYIVS